MSDILIPMAHDRRGHDMHDDCAEWAQENVRPPRRIGHETVPISRLLEALSYCPDSGRLTWRCHMTPSVRSGDEVATRCVRGYTILKLDGVQLKAHRVAFAIFHGRWPDGFIDHINGSRSDNRIANLREATFTLNAHNRRAPSANNRLGVLGVRERRGRFVAQIQVDKQFIHIGTFDTAEEASAAYWDAKRRLHHGFQGVQK